MSTRRHPLTTTPAPSHRRHAATRPTPTGTGTGTHAHHLQDGPRPGASHRTWGRILRTALVTAAATVLAPLGATASATGAAAETVVSGFPHGVTAPKDGEVLTILQRRAKGTELNPMAAVDVPHGSQEWGPDLRVQTSTGATAQQFAFVKRGEWYQLRPLSGGGRLCLEATGGTPFEGQVVQQYGCDPNHQDQPNQLWQVLPTAGGVMLRSKMGDWYMTVSTLGQAGGDMVSHLPLVMTAAPGPNAHFSLHAPGTTVEKWVNNMIIGGASINNVNCPDPYYVEEDSENSDEVDPTYNRLGDSGVRIYAESELPALSFTLKEGARFGFNNLGVPARKRSAGVRLYCNLVGDPSHRITV